MPANARFSKASLWVDPDSLKKFFAGHRKYLTVFVCVSKPQEAGSGSPTKFISTRSRRNECPPRRGKLYNGRAFKPGRRGDRSPEKSAHPAVTPYRKLLRLARGILSFFPAFLIR